MSALLTVVAVDLGLRVFIPDEKKREVREGLRDLAAADPEVLVVGSSHARTFHVLGEELASRRGGGMPLVAVPLENGKLIPYQWLVRNRIEPLVDEVGGNGRLVRPSLGRFILLTEWWDSCPHPDGVHWNLPARAWGWQEYVADLGRNGITDYNRNYPKSLLRQYLVSSPLVQNRSSDTVREMLYRLMRGQDVRQGRRPEDEQDFLQGWQRTAEQGVGCIGDPGQMAALVDLLDFAQARRLDTTIVLFPRKPATVTDKAWRTTFAQFHHKVEKIALSRGVRLLDLSRSTPLLDEDFMQDFDHVNAQGNRKFARWALANDLKFLLEPPATRHTLPGSPAVTN
ncbi:MAG: hypothetical protein R3E68_10020 [Burkholderiaceae bacterium]